MGQRSILIIEDDQDILDLLTYNLERERFQVHVARTGEVGLDLVRTVAPSIIILDLGLPGVQGLDVCRHLKSGEATAEIPVIILTARDEESDVVLGLELGADDYVTKPFKVRELLARVRAVLRRSESGGNSVSLLLQAGPVSVNPESHEVQVSGEPVELTLAEFRLLRALIVNRGKVMTRDQLLTEITAGSAYIIDRNVDVHIRSIRKKLGEAREMISTVRGVGYKLLTQSV